MSEELKRAAFADYLRDIGARALDKAGNSHAATVLRRNSSTSNVTIAVNAICNHMTEPSSCPFACCPLARSTV